MNRIEYIRTKELEKISTWDVKDAFSLIEYIRTRWTYEQAFKQVWGKKNLSKKYTLFFELHTCGLSDNEDLISALLNNTVFNSLFYKMWKSGGHYYFEITPEIIGFKTVNRYCKETGISRQAIHQQKEKYEWIIATPNLRFIKPKNK